MVIAITSGSRSRSSKLSSALRKAMSNDDTITAGFRYPVHKIALMFGWDNQFDERGKKLINTLYNTGVEYDKDIWIKKMETLIKRSSKRKKTIIITDMESPSQADRIKNIDNIRLIVCGDNETMRKGGLIDVYVESDKSIDTLVEEIMKEIKCSS